MFKSVNRHILLVLLVLSLLVVMPVRAAEVVRVVVTLAPIHSLVAGVMAGVAQPRLLVKGGASAHSYQLKPSQMRQLHNADLVIWVGESVESFMPRTLASLPAETVLMELLEVPGLVLLPARQGGMWERGRQSPAAGGHQHGDIDSHLWLDPVNAERIVAAVVERLTQLDVPHAERYRKNGQALIARLRDLDAELKQRLAGVKAEPYLVYHDAFHYFEARYGLNAVGSITVNPERRPGARRLSEIRRQVAALGVKCLFREPQFPASVTRVVSEESGLKTGVLDPLGATLQPGPELYFRLMHNLADGLVDCLAASP